MEQHRKIQIPIQIFIFVFLILICSVTHAISNPDKSSDLSSGEMQSELDKQFKDALHLIDKGSYKEAENILLSFVTHDQLLDRVYFPLGRLYKEQGFFDKAEDCFKKAAINNPLLKDYALKLLAEIYIVREELNKAVETVRQIQNKTLLQEAKRMEIHALLKLQEEEAAIETLSQYIKEYPVEWDSKLTLARLLKEKGREPEAIALFKDLYINATPRAADALRELSDMKSDIFTLDELLRRADNLFEKGNFQRAEEAYNEILNKSKEAKLLTLNSKLLFSIGMSQFKQKKYDTAAESFSLVETPEAMYWWARALYRIDDLDGFNRIIRQFEETYPKNRYLAELLLMLADEKRRAGKLNEAEEILKRILNEFPEKAENALWGIGWMNYTNGNYKESEKNFSKLTSLAKGNKRYLYWRAKSREMLSKDCKAKKISLNIENDVCPNEDDAAYSTLLQDRSYYGFLIKTRFKELNASVKVKLSKPVIPEGETYKRIEMLKFLGMNKEAIEEIKMALKSTKVSEEFKYLGQTAIELGEYKSVIYMVEDITDEEFLLFLYPLGFWDIVKDTAESRGVDPYLVVALIREESRFDPEAVSMAGAIGLMQIMPFTAQKIKGELKIELKDDSELHDIKKNILIGTHYFSLLLKEFGKIPLAIAAYNAGENALKKWLLSSKHKNIEEFIEDIPYQETRNYVKKVLRSYWQYRVMNGLPIEGF